MTVLLKKVETADVDLVEIDHMMQSDLACSVERSEGLDILLNNESVERCVEEVEQDYDYIQDSKKRMKTQVITNILLLKNNENYMREISAVRAI